MKPNFDWNKFLLSGSIKVKDLAEAIHVLPNYISFYKSRNRIPIGLKQKLDNLYGQEYINRFIID